MENLLIFAKAAQKAGAHGTPVCSG